MTNDQCPMTNAEGLSTLHDSPPTLHQINPLDALHRGMLCLIFGNQLEELLEIVSQHNAALAHNK